MDFSLTKGNSCKMILSNNGVGKDVKRTRMSRNLHSMLDQWLRCGTQLSHEARRRANQFYVEYL